MSEAAFGPASLIAVVGAGLSGLGMAIQLKRAGYTDIRIYEKADAVGGTWRDNRYPGLTCDVPSHLYSFSFVPNADWRHRYARQPEILAYAEGLVASHGLAPMLRLGQGVLAANWDPDRRDWILRLTGGGVVRARVVVFATGQLTAPRWPAVAGLDRFTGSLVHSGDWPAGLDLTGRNVAVIGTGASAIQLVPALADRVGRLTVFQRSPAWILPKRDRVYSPLARKGFRFLPGWRRLVRAWQYAAREATVPMLRQGSWFGRRVAVYAGRHLKRAVPPGPLREALRPSYPLGCKRILVSDDFYPALTRPHVHLETVPIAEVSRSGPVTADGRSHPVDVIVAATGYETMNFLPSITVTGEDGRTLSDAWAAGAAAYYGTAIPGFPNLFTLFGPNTNLGHTSVLFMIECQMRLVLAALGTMRRKGSSGIAVKRGATARFDTATQERLSRTVWAQGCGSWYVDARGRVTSNWPGSTIGFWRRTRRLRTGDFRLLT